MVKVTVDDIPITVPEGSSVLQACELAGKEIPRFCYHEKLSVAGNCRMCIVEITGSRKPLVSSCSQPVTEGMQVKTDTEIVRAARRSTMELLLINHPLDCPICDQGGECDLQDQAVAYGRSCSRFKDGKRAVTDKYLGPLIRTSMTRCIQCTRCIRFTSEITGTAELGGLNRGTDLEIAPYIEQAMDTELSGNLIDICPVGALTSKPTSFHFRSWELKTTQSIDIHDATGSNILLQIRGNEIMRILPKRNDLVNEQWLSDKGRFSLDGLKKGRLDKPWIRQGKNLIQTSWPEAIEHLGQKLKTVKAERIGAIAGDLCDAESMLSLKILLNQLGCYNIDCRQDGAYYDSSERWRYLFNTTISGIEKADALLIVGSFPRYESPTINARIRKRWLSLTEEFPIAYIGDLPTDPTYKINYLGNDPAIINDLLQGQNAFTDVLVKAKRPMILIGHSILTRNDSPSLFHMLLQLADQIGALNSQWNGVNILHTSASRVAGIDLGLIPDENHLDTHSMIEGNVDLLWLLGADELNLENLPQECFLVYQGHHGEKAAARADIILPAPAYTEKSGIYTNTEGRIQKSFRAIFPLGEAKEEWLSLLEIGRYLNLDMPFIDLDSLRNYMADVNPVYQSLGLMNSEKENFTIEKRKNDFENQRFTSVISDYFLTNSINRASPTMNECSLLRRSSSLKVTE
ncbi:NADH-quinone oxidoreductase chain 3 [Commensalibacter sp. Nvir]|uniref:NADH-quinone oxidoreductase subunit NuoG n=1 Tax=Commensalibacter sp. Nvir TaxID=3069817 RepID=UPI002D71CEBF|nr:NADH-quinone oxidoreductase chain 3 [Commensalibacter sp. Nvir]